MLNYTYLVIWSWDKTLPDGWLDQLRIKPTQPCLSFSFCWALQYIKQNWLTERSVLFFQCLSLQKWHRCQPCMLLVSGEISQMTWCNLLNKIKKIMSKVSLNFSRNKRHTGLESVSVETWLTLVYVKYWTIFERFFF